MRILSYYLTASLSACFGAAIMALLKVGARGDEMPKCATCKHYPQPDGIAHLCDYWQRLTNERGYCSNWRSKDGT
jgi:hypothetical protein